MDLEFGDYINRQSTFPKTIKHVKVPPIKCQGIKTKLVRFILGSIHWDGKGRWIEPFVGSGSVVLNAFPVNAYLADTNTHIIKFYQELSNGILNPNLVREYLTTHGEMLYKRGAEYYYEIRDRFNTSPNSLDFLFLNRSCFNGLIRFNSKGLFNVPFGKKPERFRQAYVTKISNQIDYFASVLKHSNWSFDSTHWRESLTQATSDDFVYVDPPYTGRNNDYYNVWEIEDESELLAELKNLPCGFAMSTWKENKYGTYTP